MSEPFKASYFSLLPNEILIKILGYVDSYNLVSFCDIYSTDYFLQDRNVIKTINLCKAYSLENIEQISKKISFELVTTLNVNCLYWVPASKLRLFVSKLVNLETLYAIQTNLSLSTADTSFFSKSKIKKLGISVSRGGELGLNKIYNVKTLYINVTEAKTLVSPLMIETIFPAVQQLWIEVEKPCGKEIILHGLSADNKNKIFCQINAPVPRISFEHYNLQTYYSNRRAGQPYVVCCKRFEEKQLEDVEHQSKLLAWHVLGELHYSQPYGPKDAHSLFTNEKSLDKILFQELNFYHANVSCSERCRCAVKEILKSENAQQLEKLCAMMCLFYCSDSRPNKQDTVNFSRKRIGIENESSTHHIEEVFCNFPQLQELEIYVCHQTVPHNAIQGYAFITMFERLQSLVVEIPLMSGGEFLSKVLEKCQLLQTLKVTSGVPNEKLNYNICKALPNARSLKDFRFENRNIPLDRLLTSIQCVKLQRLVVICKETKQFSASVLKEFLSTHEQLIFVYFVVQEATENSLRAIQQTLNLFKKQKSSRVFLAKKFVANEDGFPIPKVHYREMVECENKTSSLDVLRDFVDF